MKIINILASIFFLIGIILGIVFISIDYSNEYLKDFPLKYEFPTEDNIIINVPNDYEVDIIASNRIFCSLNDSYYDAFNRFTKDGKHSNKIKLIESFPNKLSIVDEDLNHNIYHFSALPGTQIKVNMDSLARELFPALRSEVKNSLTGSVNLELKYKTKDKSNLLGFIALIFLFAAALLSLFYLVPFIKNVRNRNRLIKLGLNFDKDLQALYEEIEYKYKRLISFIKKDNSTYWDKLVQKSDDLKNKSSQFLKIVQQLRNTSKEIDYPVLVKEFDDMNLLMNNISSEDTKLDIIENLKEKQKLIDLYNETKDNDLKFTLKIKHIDSVFDTAYVKVKNLIVHKDNVATQSIINQIDQEIDNLEDAYKIVNLQNNI